MWKILPFIAALAFFVGCNSTAADNTALEPTRDQRMDSLASEACGRYDACNGYGASKKFVDAAACKQSYTVKAAEIWPVAACGNGRINNSNYSACVETVKQVACTGDTWDGIVAGGSCSSGKVCTDPAH